MRFDDVTREIEDEHRQGGSANRRSALAAWPARAAGEPPAYDASDSEHEQPSWRVPESTSWRAEREREKELRGASSSESETSGGGTDDDSLLERMAARARRREHSGTQTATARPPSVIEFGGTAGRLSSRCSGAGIKR